MLQFIPFVAGAVVGAAALRWVQRRTATRPPQPPRPPAHRVPVTDGEAPPPAPAADATPGEPA